MEEHQARLQLDDRSIREEHDCQSEEIVATAICTRPRLTRQCEVPGLMWIS